MQVQPHPSWAELSPEVQTKWAGARDRSGTHPAVRTRMPSAISGPQLWPEVAAYFYLNRSGLLLPKCSLFPLQHPACATAGHSIVHVPGKWEDT